MEKKEIEQITIESIRYLEPIEREKKLKWYHEWKRKAKEQDKKELKRINNKIERIRKREEYKKYRERHFFRKLKRNITKIRKINKEWEKIGITKYEYNTQELIKIKAEIRRKRDKNRYKGIKSIWTRNGGLR